MSETEFITKEEMLDQKIADILRTVEQQVMKFKNEYEGLSLSLGNATILDEIKKIKTCIEKLHYLKDFCSDELREFVRHEKDLISSGVPKTLYKECIRNINDMIESLNDYIKGLSYIIIRLELPNITTKEAKEKITQGIRTIYNDYGVFIMKNNTLIDKLDAMKAITKEHNN